MTHRKGAPRQYEKFREVDKFKYLRDLRKPNALGKEVVLARTRKVSFTKK